MAEHLFTFTPDQIETPSFCPSEWLHLESTFASIQQDANHGARTRTAWLDTRKALEAIRSEPEGILAASGGGVPNSYRQRAETTVVGCAWWTAADGVRYVRILAARVAAPKSSYASRRPLVFASDRPVEVVFSALATRPPLKKERQADPLAYELRLALSQDPLDTAARAALADRLEETGCVYQAEEQRRLLGTALELAGAV